MHGAVQRVGVGWWIALPLSVAALGGGFVCGMGILAPMLEWWWMMQYLPLSRPFDCLAGMSLLFPLALAFSLIPKRIKTDASGVTISRGVLLHRRLAHYHASTIADVVVERELSHWNSKREVNEHVYPLYLELHGAERVSVHRYEQGRYADDAGRRMLAALGRSVDAFVPVQPS